MNKRKKNDWVVSKWYEKLAYVLGWIQLAGIIFYAGMIILGVILVIFGIE